MLDPDFLVLVKSSHDRLTRMLRYFDSLEQADIRPKRLKVDCAAECFLALKEGVDPTVVPKQVSNKLRLQVRPLKPGLFGLGQPTYSDPMPRVERELDVDAYFAVVRDVLKPHELALLEAREIHDIAFDELARQNLAQRGIPVDPQSQNREGARLRKQVNRIRARCAQAIVARYPHAAEDIACWN